MARRTLDYSKMNLNELNSALTKLDQEESRIKIEKSRVESYKRVLDVDQEALENKAFRLYLDGDSFKIKFLYIIEVDTQSRYFNIDGIIIEQTLDAQGQLESFEVITSSPNDRLFIDEEEITKGTLITTDEFLMQLDVVQSTIRAKVLNS